MNNQTEKTARQIARVLRSYYATKGQKWPMWKDLTPERKEPILVLAEWHLSKLNKS